MPREHNDHLVFDLNPQKNTRTIFFFFLFKAQIILCFPPVSCSEAVYICSHQLDLWLWGKLCVSWSRLLPKVF